MTWKELKEFLDSQIEDENIILYIDISDMTPEGFRINRYKDGDVAVWS